MEGEKFSSFARNYLRKRPRFSPQSPSNERDYHLPSTSSGHASTSSSTGARVNDRVAQRKVLIEPSDEQLLSWQEQQISKCIVDNTVNRVVESYLTFFEEDNPNSEAIPDFDREARVASYHAYRAHQNFEESAILWAIDEHGLQQHAHENRLAALSSSSSSSSPLPDASGDDKEFGECSTSSKVTLSKSEVENQLSKVEAATSVSEEVSTERTKPATSEEFKHDSIIVENGSIENDEHFDFMEAAVSVAIQEKGLVPYSIQMSPNR